MCTIIGTVISVACIATSSAPRLSGPEAAAIFAVAPYKEPPPQLFTVPKGWTLIGSVHGDVSGSWLGFAGWWIDHYGSVYYNNTLFFPGHLRGGRRGRY